MKCESAPPFCFIAIPDAKPLRTFAGIAFGLCGLVFVQCKLKGWGDFVYPTLTI